MGLFMWEEWTSDNGISSHKYTVQAWERSPEYLERRRDLIGVQFKFWSHSYPQESRAACMVSRGLDSTLTASDIPKHTALQSPGGRAFLLEGNQQVYIYQHHWGSEGAGLWALVAAAAKRWWCKGTREIKSSPELCVVCPVFESRVFIWEHSGQKHRFWSQTDWVQTLTLTLN